VSASETINAIAYESGYTDSSVASASYTINSGGGGGGSTYTTTYTYDLYNNLNTVTMTRGTVTQTRTFNYNGSQLVNATNPENGTVTYTYNSYEKVATKVDNSGQTTQYAYDTYARLVQVQHLPAGSNSPDPCQTVNYSYDGNPYDGTYSGYYTLGRLAAVQYYGGHNFGGSGSSACATTFTEMYNYSQGGETGGKRLQVTRNGASVNLDSSYSYDPSGNIMGVQYPVDVNGTGPSLTYGYDSMERLNTLTGWTNSTQTPIITGATYGPSNELLTLSGTGGAPYLESRTYNANLQLTQLSYQSAPGVQALYMSYNYSATQNNGKITSQTDNISGEQVVYTYDALNRLASAQAASGAWGQSYNYDGFGNLTDQNVTAGSAPEYHVVPNPATNQVGATDANGNSTGSGTYPSYGYDVENRLINATTGYQTAAWYSYAPSNQRVWRGVVTSSTITTDEITFWSITGQKLATYNFTQSGSNASVTIATTNYYFGRKLIKGTSGYVTPDRLGSIGKFYPWGQEKPSATQNGTEKFTGYFRDADTGLDYAMD
jgi:YD repeat-containing protein